MHKKTIPFSVITASFNSGTKLLATYESLSAQAVEFEYIIMDGVSTDGSQELGQKLAADDSRVRFFSEPDKGVYDAMNKAIKQSRGQYLYFIGAGDLLLPGALLEIEKYLPNKPNSLVYGDCLMDAKRTRGKFRRIDLAGLNICHQAIFYGREVFEICGAYDCQYPVLADWELNMRCFGSRRVKHLYAPVLVAEFEPGGLSGAGDPAFRARQWKLVRRHLGMLTYLYITIHPIYHRHRQSISRMISRGRSEHKA